MQNNLDQIIIGSLLGDGCIPKLDNRAKNNRLQIVHSLKQEQYCLYKYNLFKEFNLTTPTVSYYTTKDSRCKLGYFETLRFRTKSNVVFNSYRQLFYPEGKKIIPEIILNRIEAQALAIWFMDDGYRAGGLDKGRIFSTCGFSKECVKRIAEYLKTK